MGRVASIYLREEGMSAKSSQISGGFPERRMPTGDTIKPCRSKLGSNVRPADPQTKRKKGVV